MPLSQSWVEQHPFIVNTILPGLVFLILGGIITWYFAIRTAGTKTLDYEVISDVRVLRDVASGLNSKIAVTVDGDTVEQPRFVTVRYRNTGNSEIKEDDFDGGIELADTTGLKNAKLVHVSNKKMKATESGLMPNLRFFVESLNRKEFFDVQYLVDGTKRSSPLIPDYRIKGETRAGKHVTSFKKAQLFVQLAVGLACIPSAYISGYLISPDAAVRSPLIAGIMIGATIVILFGVFYRSPRRA